VLRPFFTGFLFLAIPAEFNSFFLGTRDKRAPGTHSGFCFTSTAPACTFSMVMRAKSAGKPANANFRVFDFHWYAFYPGITRYSDNNESVDQTTAIQVCQITYDKHSKYLLLCRICPETPTPVKVTITPASVKNDSFLIAYAVDSRHQRVRPHTRGSQDVSPGIPDTGPPRSGVAGPGITCCPRGMTVSPGSWQSVSFQRNSS